jgi:methyltransferase (TIGR00027 family)
MNAEPSRTAEYMALFRALESAQAADRRLFDDPDAARFLRPALRVVVIASRWRVLRAAIVAFIDRRWPGPRLSAVVRTRVIDDFVVDAVDDGCTQLLLLGAGYDTRATRLAQVSCALVFEVDHPATQTHKRSVLGALPERIRYVPVDFEHDRLVSALADAGFDRDQQSCILWEGVFSYLTPAAIDTTLDALVALCAPGSRVLLTYVDQRVLDAPSSYPQAWLTVARDVGEPFQTGLDPSQARAFFAQRKLCLHHDESTTEAGMRLGVAGAQSIPSFYRLATLSVNDR